MAEALAVRGMERRSRRGLRQLAAAVGGRSLLRRECKLLVNGKLLRTTDSRLPLSTALRRKWHLVSRNQVAGSSRRLDQVPFSPSQGNRFAYPRHRRPGHIAASVVDIDGGREVFWRGKSLPDSAHGVS